MISVFNCGYESRHRKTLDMLRPEGSSDYTLILIKTEAFFEYGNVYTELLPNTAILYDKHSYVHYGCRTPDYNDDWIHFDLEEEDLPFLTDLEIPFHTPVFLSYAGQLSEYIRLIVLEKHSAKHYRKQILDSLMRTLLYSLASQIHARPEKGASHKYYSVMNDLRISILNAPHRKWTVEGMSDSVHMSSSYFQHLYKELFGTSCMQDVISARLKNACFYLRTTEMSIQSLAGFCGYDNEFHFMRQFKKYTRMTPSQYRNHYRNQSP
ncbi:AraC family transcriptional regulator [Lachnospiraceae bacterium 54-53]